MSYKSRGWYLTAVSEHFITFHEKHSSGADHRHTVFIGWNNLLTRMVDRYLLVTEYAEGKKRLAACLTYRDERPKGYIDPFTKVQDEFNLASTGKVDVWNTATIKTSHGTNMIGKMFTQVGGKHTINTTLHSTLEDRKTIFSVVYSNQVNAAIADHDDVIFKYRGQACHTVTNFFNVPEVCVDDLLALEYGCGYAELRPRH